MKGCKIYRSGRENNECLDNLKRYVICKREKPGT